MKSIYKQFYYKLIIATSLFIIILSILFYGYTRSMIFESLNHSLLKDAKLILKISKSKNINKNNFDIITHHGVSVDIVQIKQKIKTNFTYYQIKEDHFVDFLYPFDKKELKFIKITKNINSSIEMLNKIFNNLFLLSFGGLLLIILYAFTVSKTLLRPIIEITNKLSNMNEHSLDKINHNNLPIEFHALANSINSLTNRIETYIKFKKELFIGAAHELKTPLAVMKLKNEVTLIKKRDIVKYEETLELTIKQINDMNKMISSILDIGRAEGAQFEKPKKIDLVQFLKRKTNDYRMLSSQKNITITFYANVNYLYILVRITLLNQIIQNLVQNSIKFTNNEKSIAIKLEKTKEAILLIIIDEGIGITEDIDLFAPFKKIGVQSGVGLGLFLAKNAANSMGAKINLKNHTDKSKGTIATISLPLSLIVTSH